jgi:glycosyltransferase involved in cell wall biosynthesis
VKVLFLISRLDCSGPAKQLRLLATGLDRARFEPLVCVLRGAGPFVQPLRGRGVRVEILGGSYWCDPRPVLKLRQLLRGFAPDVAHVWRSSALPYFRLAAGRSAPPVIASVSPLGPDAGGFVERWQLRRIHRLVVQDQRDADRLRRDGLPAEKLVTIVPGVEEYPAVGEASWPTDLAMPRDGRLIACLGELDRSRGSRDAVWAFDILRFLFDDLRLLLIGDGPERERIRAFARKLHCETFLHLAGRRPDGPDLLRAADVVWTLNRKPGGVNAALEAMALGKPLVATCLGGLADVVADGETGFLVPPGDKAALARQTRLLLEDNALRQRLGEAGRQRAREHFSAAELVRRYSLLYEEL